MSALILEPGFLIRMKIHAPKKLVETIGNALVLRLNDMAIIVELEHGIGAVLSNLLKEFKIRCKGA